jgi:hypothetical protein
VVVVEQEALVAEVLVLVLVPLLLAQPIVAEVVAVAPKVLLQEQQVVQELLFLDIQTQEQSQLAQV